ncbi:hypothetical protein [Roseobacter sp. CCS2]|uniref:hypothetical protein n=1 Tax=Roseobacter sp. CCS2 TaxID=391593 RepID=UPI0012EA71A4|nr:hypothetical protein [Roseobacter sp. CCS2]
MRPFSEYRVRKKLGSDALILGVDATRVAGKIRDIRLRRIWRATRKNRLLPRFAGAAITHMARATRPFNFDDGDIDLVSFESGNTYQRMQDVWTHRSALQDSTTYQQISDALARDGQYQHKNYKIVNSDEITLLLQTCFLDLLNSLAEEGYQHGKTSTYGTGGTGKAVIWRDGRIRHENGATHRLAAARIVGMRTPFPLRIVGVHQAWLDAQNVRGFSHISQLTELLKRVDGVLQ